jgi:hypothetical protein
VLVAFDPATGKRGRTVYSGLSKGGAIDCDVSADAASLIVITSEFRLVLVDVATGGGRDLALGVKLKPFRVTFAPDSRRVFVTGAGYGGKVASIDLEGRGEVILDAPGTWIGNPRVSRDGARLAVDRRKLTTTRWLLEPR